MLDCEQDYGCQRGHASIIDNSHAHRDGDGVDYECDRNIAAMPETIPMTAQRLRPLTIFAIKASHCSHVSLKTKN